MAEVKHGLRLKLYNTMKRRNSTKQPNETWFYLDPDGDLYISAMVVFKEPTDLLQPEITIAVDREDIDHETGAGEFDSYWLQNCNYAALDDRYYWIERIVSVRRDHWEVTLISDPLATFKQWIGETKVFAEYTGHGNNDIIDSRLPRLTNGTSGSAVASQALFNASEVYLVGILGENGFGYYKINKTSYSDLMKNIQKNLDVMWDEALKDMPKDPTPTSIADDATLGNALSKSTKDTIKAFTYMGQCLKWSLQTVYKWISAGFSKENALSFVTDVWRYPVDIMAGSNGTSEEIMLGNLKTGVVGERLNKYEYRKTATLSVPSSLAPPSPAWLGRAEYCHWNLYVPYFGNIEVPADLVRGGSSIITVTANCNVTSGMCNIHVSLKGFASQENGITLGECNTQIGGRINFGVGMTSNSSAAVSAIGTVAGAASALVPGGKELSAGGRLLQQCIGLAYAGQSAINFASAVTPVGSCISGTGAGILLDPNNPEGKIMLTRYRFEVSANPNSLGDTIGMPTFDSRLVKNCGGYVKACGASFAAKRATAQEIDTINLALNSGLYYE